MPKKLDVKREAIAKQMHAMETYRTYLESNGIHKQDDPIRICGNLWANGTEEQRASFSGGTQGRDRDNRPPGDWWDDCIESVGKGYGETNKEDGNMTDTTKQEGVPSAEERMAVLERKVEEIIAALQAAKGFDEPNRDPAEEAVKAGEDKKEEDKEAKKAEHEDKKEEDKEAKKGVGEKYEPAGSEKDLSVSGAGEKTQLEKPSAEDQPKAADEEAKSKGDAEVLEKELKELKKQFDELKKGIGTADKPGEIIKGVRPDMGATVGADIKKAGDIAKSYLSKMKPSEPRTLGQVSRDIEKMRKETGV